MSYTKQTWFDNDPSTPAEASRVNHMEDGIADADIRLTALELDGSTAYPLEGYGFHSATSSAEAISTASTFSAWHVRIWVSAGKVITKVGMVVTTAGTLGAGGLNGFAIYSDDGTTQLGLSNNADSLWTATGLRTVSMASNIAATSAGRFVRVVANVTGYSGTPSVAYAANAPSAALNGTASGTLRTAFLSTLSSWPSTINPDTLGTATNFLPFVVLG